MIGTQNLGKAFGARSLFEGVSLKLVPQARYGLVGANGSGKTTFLKILAGDEQATEGSVSIPSSARVGVLRQDRFMNDEDRILDVAMSGDELVFAALAEQKRIAEGASATPGRLAELEDLLRTHDGYTLEARTSAVLEGLGIPIASHALPLAILSGGFKLRVLLAQVLLGGPDVLLLDEPTNHLDILSIRWLEKFLAAYRGTAVVISHDQRFLDNVATHVLDVDYETITLYVGNYAAFEVLKRDTRARKEAEIARAEAEIAHKRAFVERFGAKATKARQAQSRLKQIEKIEVEELADTSRRAPMLRFTPARQSGRDVLEVRGVDKSYGSKHVLRKVSLSVRRGERVGIIGPNGLGKSTLVKILAGELDADSGEVKWGHEAKVGYFAQDHREILPEDGTTPLDFIWAAAPKEGTAFVRGQLGRVLFSGEDVEKSMRSLSGGEAARLVFCRLMVEAPNVLLLDEPTNHLDLEAIHALAEGLQAFEGTVLFVSHDRWFVSQVATRIVEITPDGPRDFPGTYAEYLERQGDDHLDADAVVLKEKKDQRARVEPTAPASGTDWEDKKRKRNLKKELPGRRDKALAAIEVAEARRKAITEGYAADGFWETTSRERVAELEAEDKALAAKVDTLMAEWEAIEAEIEKLAAEG